MDEHSVTDWKQAQQMINALDFSLILDKMIKHNGWLESDALETCQQYKNYLFLIKKYGKESRFPPSDDIDEFWHSHILDTKKYIEDCNKIFGSYLHHYPYFGIDGQTNDADLSSSFAALQKVYAQEFGGVITATRSRFPKWIYVFLKKLETRQLKKQRLSLA